MIGPLAIQYSRMYSGPIDVSMRHETLESATTYASSPAAYPGQIIAVRVNGVWREYIIQDDRSLKLTEGGIGEGDGITRGEVDTIVDGLEVKIGENTTDINELETKVGNLESIDTITKSEVDIIAGELETKIDGNTTRIDGLQDQIDGIEPGGGAIDLSKIEQDIQQLKTEVIPIERGGTGTSSMNEIANILGLFSASDGAKLAAGTDLNNITYINSYCDSDIVFETLLNTPEDVQGAPFLLKQITMPPVVQDKPSAIVQIIIYQDVIYMRQFESGNGWYGWNKLARSEDVYIMVDDLQDQIDDIGSGGGIDLTEIQRDIHELKTEILPIERGGTGVSDIDGFANSLELISMSGGFEITDGMDMNTITHANSYCSGRGSSGVILNRPMDIPFIMKQIYFDVDKASGSSMLWQIAVGMDNVIRWRNRGMNGIWGGWSALPNPYALTSAVDSIPIMNGQINTLTDDVEELKSADTITRTEVSTITGGLDDRIGGNTTRIDGLQDQIDNLDLSGDPVDLSGIEQAIQQLKTEVIPIERGGTGTSDIGDIADVLGLIPSHGSFEILSGMDLNDVTATHSYCKSGGVLNSPSDDMPFGMIQLSYGAKDGTGFSHRYQFALTIDDALHLRTVPGTWYHFPNPGSFLGNFNSIESIGNVSNAAKNSVDALTEVALVKGTITTVNIPSSNWVLDGSIYKATINLPDTVTATSEQAILPPVNPSAEMLTAIQKANLQDGGQGDGFIKLCAYGEVPTIGIDLRIISKGETYV